MHSQIFTNACISLIMQKLIYLNMHVHVHTHTLTHTHAPMHTLTPINYHPDI